MANWWEDNILIRPVSEMDAEISLAKMREQQAETKRQEEAAQRLNYQEGIVGDTLSQATALLDEVGADAASPIARMLGQDQIADEINRNAGAMEQAIQSRQEGGPVPDWAQNAVRGGLRSVPPIVIGGRLGAGVGGAVGGATGQAIGGFGGSIGTAMTMEGNQAITEGRDAGLEGADLAKYAASQALIEGAVASAFQAVGMGGAESMFARQALSGGVRQAAKEAAVRTGQEIPEEIMTEIAHAIAADYAEVRPDGLTNEALAQLAFETTMQTIVTMGAMEAPRVAATALQGQDQQPTEMTPDQAEQLAEMERVQQERERLASEQAAQQTEPQTAQQEVPKDDTVSPQAEGGATPISVDQLAETVSGVGKGIVDGIYKKAWNDVQSGKLAEMEKPPLFEQMVLLGYKRGVVRSIDDVREIAKGLTGKFEEDKAIGIANLNRLAEKYQIVKQPEQQPEQQSQPDVQYPVSDEQLAEAFAQSERDRMEQQGRDNTGDQPDVPAETTVIPTAGETSDVPSVQPAEPREEVILNEQDVQQGNVQGNQEGNEGGQGQVGTQPTEPASPPVTPESSAEGGRTSPPSVPAQDSQQPIGKNAEGEDVYENEQGVRSVSTGKVRIDEKVILRPQRRLGGGIEYVGAVDVANREDRFKTVDETQTESRPVDETQKDDTVSSPNPAPEVDAEGFARFAPETGTLGIPRAEMPQVTSEQRGALSNFARARGVEYERTEVLPTDLKPSQAEYSPEKVQRAREFEGPERAILVSSDGYVVDGHHQWKRNLEDRPNEPMEVIRLGTDAKSAIDLVREFPSSQTSNETGGGQRRLGQPKPESGNVSTQQTPTEFELNRDRAIAKVQKTWGQTVTAREPQTAEEQDQIDFLRSRGKQASFVDGDESFSGALDEGSGFMLIAGNRDTNDIWRTIGHELAHETKLDRAIPIGSEELAAGREKRLARAKGPYKQRLESEPELLDREARADIVGEFMRDKAFRDRIARENPTMWERLREAVLKVVGKWTPRNEAEAMVLKELRKQSAPKDDTVSSPAKSPESTAEIPQLDEAELEAMIEAEFDAQMGVKPETQEEPKAPRKLGNRGRRNRAIDSAIDLRGDAIADQFFNLSDEDRALFKDMNAFRIAVARAQGRRNQKIMDAEDAAKQPRTRIGKAAEKARQEADDLWAEFNKQAKDKLTSGLDPDLAKLAVRVALAEIKADTLSFAAFVENTVAKVPADMLDKIKPYMETAWKVAHKRGMTDDPGGKFDDVLRQAQKDDTVSSPPTKKIGSTDYGTVDKPNRVALGEHFADQFRSGKAYGRITDARKEAADLIGGTPKDGTQAIKVIDESIELGVVIAAREIAQSGETDEAIYDQLVDLYSRQPNLGTRTSTSMRDQAYSTPAPLSFLVNKQAGISQEDTVYDSSAGNGMLLIVGGNRFANELNPDRAAALRSQGIETTNEDATEFKLGKPITALAINPPFGEVKNEDGSKKQWNIDGVRTDKVDHAITLNSLAEIPDDGKVAIIIGAKGFEQRKPKENRARGRAYLNGKGFYDAVYENYNVVDHYTVHGDLYSRQGASFPVDVIIIEGRGASSRPKPYNIVGGGIPQVFDSWQELKDAKLLGRVRESDGSTGTRTEDNQQTGVPAETGVTDEQRPAGQREGTEGTGDAAVRDGRRLGEPEPVGRPDETSSVPAEDQSTVGTEQRGDNQPGRNDGRSTANDGRVDSKRTGRTKGDDAGRDGLTEQQAAEQADNETADEESEVKGDQYQSSYTPGSGSKSVDALIPNNHQTAVQAALDAIVDRYGNIDEFVASELGYDQESLYDAFSAEQIDALALGIARHKEGKAFILGDQTGVGKGRVAAGIMIYAKRQGFAPVFLTEKPTLYADMIRDLIDIGQSTADRPFKPLMTNTTPKKSDQIKLEDGRVLKQTAKAAAERIVEAVDNFVNDKGLVATTKKATKKNPAETEEYDAIFTTYSQMATKNGELKERHEALRKLSPKAFFILDESHNAGGTQNQEDGRQSSDDDGDQKIPVSQMMRDLISAETAGVYFSSATFAKRPSVMDLYAKTGMTAATGEDGASLAGAIAAGGVPLQQVVSQQLVESGAYLRRERSFDGVEFSPQVYDVPTDGAEQSAAVFRAINAFDRVKQQILQAELDEEITSEGGTIRPDWATGDAGMTSTNFSSILWNLTDQMLLAVKADAIADEAIASIKRGEAPVIYVDATMEAALNAYIESSGIKPGDQADFSFRDLLQRYLDRSREVLVQRDVEDRDSYEQVRLTDEQLGERGLAAFNEAQELIDNFAAEMPASPIDWIRKRIEDAGYVFGEYTGRQNVMRYDGANTVTLEQRPADEVGAANRIEMVRKFNAGELDVLLFNQSGSTGISMHASEKFQNQKPRHMIIGQAAKNIDTFMQSLGRVHRTGQVTLPKFTLAMTNLPAEIRPASVLVKKLASLNANVTASDKGSVSFDIPDIMNQIGDRIVADYLAENDELNRALNEGQDQGLVRTSRGGAVTVEPGIARKASGRMAIMPLETQQEFWDSVTETFTDMIEELDRMGANPLSAQVTELDARTVESFPIFDGDPEADNAFERPAYIEKVIAKRPGKPMTPEEVSKKVTEFYKLPESASEQQLQNAASEWQRATLREVRAAVEARIESIREVGANRGDEPSKINTRVQREQEVYDKFASMVRSFAPGLSLSIWEGGATETLEVIPGVVLSIARKGKGGHPASMAKWRVEIALGSPDRVVRLSLSQLAASMESDGDTNEDGENRQEGWQIFSNRKMIDETILKDFEESEVSTVETRYIGTGNILAAFNIFKDNRGRVTFFRDSEGNLRRGVLLPRRFNVDKWAKDRPVVLDDVNHIRQFLAAGNYLETPDKALNVMMLRGDMVVRAPKSRSRGGKYTLNPAILEASSPQEFVSIGARMEMVIDDPAQQDAVLQAIIAVAPLQATSEKELARRIKNGDDNNDTPDVIKAFSAPTETASGTGTKQPRRLGSGKDDTVSSPKKSLGTRPEPVLVDGVRQADIVTTWSRLFSVPIRIGGYKASRGKNKVALGIYNHLTEIVRMREGNAFGIIVASHEVGHHIDKKLNLFSGDKRNSKLEQLKKDDPQKYNKVYAQLQALDYGYPQTMRVDEGIAEAVRQIITGTAKNARLAPEAVAWVEEQIMADPKFGPAMKQAVEQAKQFKDQGAIKRAQMVFGGPPMDLDDRARRRSALRKAINSIYSALVDRRLVLSEFDKDVAAAKPLREGEASVGEMVAVFDGRVSAMAAKALKDGVHTIDGTRISDASIARAQELLEGNETTAEADAYMVARFGLTLPSDYNFGMDRKDAQEYVDWVESDPGRAKRWQEYHRIHSEYFNSLVQLEVIDGDLSPEEAERILGENKELYVPLMREMGDSRIPRRLGGGTQMVELPKRFQRRTKSGSGRPVMPIIEQAIRRTRHHYSRVVRQQIHNKIVQQISEREGLAKWIDEIPPGTKVDSGTVDQILGQLVANGFIDEDRAYAFRQAQKVRDGGTLTYQAIDRLAEMYEIEQSTDIVSQEDAVLDRLALEPDLNSVVMFYKPDYRRPNGKYVIKVMRGDQAKLYEVAPELYETLLGMPEESHSFLNEAADWLNRRFKAGAVGVNTGFLISNLFTDAGTFAVNSKYTTNEQRALKSWQWSKDYAAAVTMGSQNDLVEVFREFGGELYNYYAVDERSLEKTARRLGSKGKKVANAKELFTALGDQIENAADYLRTLTAMSDVGPRLAEAEGYLKTQGFVLKDGKFTDAKTGKAKMPTRDQFIKAMHAAADVTYNYRRRGWLTNKVERIFPFTNAAIQSLDKTVRTYKDALTGLGSTDAAKRKMANQAFMALMALNTIYLLLKYFNMDDEEELDQWEKDGYVTINVPGGSGRVTIRMSREHSWLANSMLAGMRYFFNDEKDAVRDFARQEMGNRIPFGASGAVGTTIESFANYDTFRGRNIEPDYMRTGESSVSPKYRYDEQTTELSKMLGKNNVLSPMKLDHLLSGYSGGQYRRWAQTGEKIAIPMLQAMGMAENADVQPWSIRDIPFLRGIYRDNTPNASIDQMYEEFDKLSRQVNDMNAAGQLPTPELVQQRRMIDNAITVMQLLRESSGPEYDSSVNRVAIARDVLGKADHPNYPHPLYSEIPEEAAEKIRKMAFNDLDALSRDLGRPSKSKEQSDEEYAQEVAIWEARQEGDRAFWERHIDSPIVQDVLKEVKLSPAFRDTLFGEGKPKYDPGSETFQEFAEEIRRFGQRQQAAQEFLRIGQGAQ